MKMDHAPIFILFFCLLANIVLGIKIRDVLIIGSFLGFLVIILLLVFKNKNIRESFRKRQITNPWFFNGVIYLYFESLALCSTVFIYNIFNLWENTHIDTARYLLSAIIQSEAAILSLVISITLIGVQFISQKYSTYGTTIFKNNPNLWILLSIYIFSLLFGVFSLKSIYGESMGDISNNLLSLSINDIQIWQINIGLILCLEIFLFVTCLLSLIPYYWNILTVFIPVNILQYQKFKILSTNPNPGDQDNSDLNSDIISIFDIIRISAKDDDINTMDFGFLQLSKIIQEIKDPNDFRIQKIKIYLDDLQDLEKNKMSQEAEKLRNSIKLYRDLWGVIY